MGNEKDQDTPSKKNDGAKTDGESLEEKLPYPKSVFLIIATEFCERFSYYGMRTVLSLYFKFLKFDEADSTVLFHSFVSLCYFAPILGATLADSFLGKFRTIFYLCCVYILGELVLTLGAVGDTEDGNKGIEGMPAAAVSFIGLFLIAIGTGGIKPCVAPFGAEQFELPQQESQMKTFFSWFYASINSGAMISSILTPYLRNSPCFGQETCFPLAFGVPSALMVVALCFFVMGQVFGLYKNRIPDENIIVKTTKCIVHAIREWWSRRGHEKLDSVLDYAKGRFGERFVDDVKALQGVVYVFLPVPVFWSLFDQQGSSWTFQATRMKARLGESFELLPDTIQVANAVLILVFIPMFEYGIYPVLTKFRLCRTPLQRIVTGGVLAGIAFLISGFIELKLQDGYPVLPTDNQIEFSFYNGLNDACGIPVFKGKYHPGNESSEGIDFSIDFNNPKSFEDQDLNRPYYVSDRRDNGVFVFDAVTFNCSGKPVEFSQTKLGPFTLASKSEDPKPEENVADSAYTILFTVNVNNKLKAEGLIYPGKTLDKYEKPADGFPFVKFFWNLEMTKEATIEVKNDDEAADPIVFFNNETIGDRLAFNLPSTGKFNILLTEDGTTTPVAKDYDFFYGGNYQRVIQRSETHKAVIREDLDVIITPPNSLHMLWQLPQYVVITAGEIMFSITTLSFAFTEAPVSLKAIMMAVQNLTVAFGDVIVIILIPILTKVLANQAYVFFTFACLMFADMALMAFMTRNYQYKDKANQLLSES